MSLIADTDANVYVVTLAVDSDRGVPNISIPAVVADDFEYVINFTDNVVPPEIRPLIPLENNPCLTFMRLDLNMLQVYKYI